MLHRTILAFGLAIAAISLGMPDAVLADEALPGPIKAMPWLHEGLRITFYDRFATVPGVVPGFPGRADLQGIPAAGQGPSQVTIVRIDGDMIVLQNRTSLVHGQGAPEPIEVPGVMGPVGAKFVGMKPWIEPESLAMYLKTPVEGMVAIPVQAKMGEKTVAAISIESKGAEYDNIFVYDVATGLLLHRGSSVLIPGLKATPAGLINRTDKNIQLRDFVSLRDVKVPWANEPAPAWVSKGKVLHYNTTMVLRNPNGPPISLGGREDITITASGNGWATGEIARVNEGARANIMKPPVEKAAWGNSELEGLWAGPAALAALREGQVLDDDPVMKIQTVVSKIDDKFVTITESCATVQMDCQYDKHNGMAVFTRRVTVGIARTERTRQLAGTE